MFHRQINDRSKTLAPFLLLDDDAYVVPDWKVMNNFRPGTFVGRDPA
jgi:hypothetical protein